MTWKLTLPCGCEVEADALFDDDVIPIRFYCVAHDRVDHAVRAERVNEVEAVPR